MRHLTPRMLKRLELAARLKATPASWESIAKQLNCPVEVCRRWPEQYPREWRRLFHAADRRLDRESHQLGRAILRDLARTADPKIKLGAASRLYQTTPAKPLRAKTPSLSSEDRELAAYFFEIKGLTDEKLNQLIADYLAARDGDSACENLPGAPKPE